MRDSKTNLEMINTIGAFSNTGSKFNRPTQFPFLGANLFDTKQIDGTNNYFQESLR